MKNATDVQQWAHGADLVAAQLEAQGLSTYLAFPVQK